MPRRVPSYRTVLGRKCTWTLCSVRRRQASMYPLNECKISIATNWMLAVIIHCSINCYNEHGNIKVSFMKRFWCSLSFSLGYQLVAPALRPTTRRSRIFSWWKVINFTVSINFRYEKINMKNETDFSILIFYLSYHSWWYAMQSKMTEEQVLH